MDLLRCLDCGMIGIHNIMWLSTEGIRNLMQIIKLMIYKSGRNTIMIISDQIKDMLCEVLENTNLGLPESRKCQWAPALLWN